MILLIPMVFVFGVQGLTRVLAQRDDMHTITVETSHQVGGGDNIPTIVTLSLDTIRVVLRHGDIATERGMDTLMGYTTQNLVSFLTRHDTLLVGGAPDSTPPEINQP
jgi:histidine ammonia-lyase